MVLLVFTRSGKPVAELRPFAFADYTEESCAAKFVLKIYCPLQEQ